MKCRLHDTEGNVIKEFKMEDSCVPTPTAYIDGATDIVYVLGESGNAYDYFPVNYGILGTKSEAAVDTTGKMYWSRKAQVNV